MGSGREFIIFHFFFSPSFLLSHFHNKVLSYLFCHWKVRISFAFFMNRVNRGDTKVGLNHLGKLVKDDGAIFNALHVSRGLALLYQEGARMHKKMGFNGRYIAVRLKGSFIETRTSAIHCTFPGDIIRYTIQCFETRWHNEGWGSTWASELTVDMLNMVVGDRLAAGQGG